MTVSSREDKNKPFFILGSQRSGTTMLRLILNRHSRLAVPHESKFIMAFYPRLRGYGDLSDLSNVKRLLGDIADHRAVREGQLLTDPSAVLSRDVTSFPKLIDAIMTEKARQMGKVRWGDKTPYYITHIDKLWELFPDSKIVHLVRDGRDVVVSQRKIEWMSNNVAKLARDWWWKTTLCHKVGSVRGDESYIEIRYEDLITEPKRAVMATCEFLGESYEPGMLDFNQESAKEVPAGSLKWHQSSVAAPDPSKLGSWKHELSKSDRIVFEQNAGDALDLFGYPRERMSSTLRSRLKNFYYAAIMRW